MATSLARRLRGIAGSSMAGLQAEQRETLRDAAAEIEGHNEAFSVVVEDKRGLLKALEHSHQNNRHTLDLLGDWRELLVVLQRDHPTDIRLKRALAGEKPLAPQRSDTGTEG